MDRKATGSFWDGTVLMPIQKVALRIFRTFICIKRIPPPPLFYCVPHLFIVLPLASYLTDVLLPSTSAIWKHFHFLFPLLYYLGSARVLVVSLLYIPSSFYFYSSPPPTLLHHILLIYSLCLSKKLECLL